MASLLKDFLPPEVLGFGLNCLNYAMFLGGLMVKLPQIVAIVRTMTVKGLSEASLAIEILACVSFCSYNLLMEHPFKTWGEMALITVQCVIQILLYWGLTTERLAIVPRAAGVVATVAAVLILWMGLLPREMLPLLGLIPTVLGAVARLPQVVMNFRQRHTGNMSIITWGLSSCGNIVRIITTLAAISDMITLAGHVIAGVLNWTLVMQILFYWHRTEEVIALAKKENEAKKE